MIYRKIGDPATLALNVLSGRTCETCRFSTKYTLSISKNSIFSHPGRIYPHTLELEKKSVCKISRHERNLPDENTCYRWFPE